MTRRSAAGLAGLAHLLDTAGAMPPADAVAEALVHGPAAPYAAHTAVILVLEDDHLRRVGFAGQAPAEPVGLDPVPLTTDLLVCQAVREAEPLVAGPAVAVPISSRGSTIGACGITCAEGISWAPADVAVLKAIGSALGLWLGHPAMSRTTPRRDGHEPRLTRRQCAILALVAEGRTTGSIAESLGYSTSTVKQELTTVMRLLEAPTRRAAADRAVRERLCLEAAP